MSDRQWSSCGGFCGCGGCNRENVKVSKQREALEMALAALDSDSPDIMLRTSIAIREALAEPEPWTPDDMAYRPGGLPMDAEQEPVAWYDKYGMITHDPFEGVTPLYAAPPTRKPLTDEDIDAEFDRECWVTVVFADGARGIALDKVTARDFARAIERAHGIDD